MAVLSVRGTMARVTALGWDICYLIDTLAQRLWGGEYSGASKLQLLHLTCVLQLILNKAVLYTKNS